MCKRLKYSRYILPYIGSIVLLLCTLPVCRAQLDATAFQDFTQTIVNPYIVNPSASDTSYSFKIRANNINELGLIKNVSRFYVDADKKIRSQRDNAFHFIGLQVLNSKLGDYISRSRLQVRYSWFAQLSEKASLSSGVSLGFVNYAFLTTHGGTGGSDYAPDGMIGIRYLRPKTSIGFSIQQLFPSVLIPVSQSFRLQRLYNLDVSQRFNLSPKTCLTTYGAVQYTGDDTPLYSVGLMSDLADVVMVGVNYFSMKKTSFNFGIKRVRIFGSYATLVMTYSVFHSSFPLSDNTFELFVALQK